MMADLQKVIRHGNSVLAQKQKIHQPYLPETKRRHEAEYNEVTNCEVCCKPFDLDEHKKCFHHCHYTGKYLGAVCNLCNRQIKCVPVDVPIFFHNWKGYDSHHIFRSLRIDEWKEIMSEQNIFYMCKSGVVEICREREKVLNTYLSNINYVFYRGVQQEREGRYLPYHEKGYYVYLVCHVNENAVNDTVIVDENNQSTGWLLSNERIEEIKTEIDWLEHLELYSFPNVGPKILAKKSIEEAKAIANDLSEYFKGETLHFPENTSMKTVVKKYKELKVKYQETYRNNKELRVIMENKRKSKMLIHRNMKFVDSIAMFGPAGSSFDNLATTIKYQDLPPAEFKAIIENLRKNKKFNETEYEEMNVEERKKYKEGFEEFLSYSDKRRFNEYRLYIAQKNFPALFDHYRKEGFDDSVIELLSRKGVYPYEYVDTVEKFNEGFPGIEAFYNGLTKQSISQEEYEYAVSVYNMFNCSSFRDYHKLYLETDVLLLRDIMKHFQRGMIENFYLDPFHFISLPSYTEASLLYFLFRKGQEIGLLNNQQGDLYEECQAAIRGGICVASKQYIKAGPGSCIKYVDCNSLYLNPERNMLPTGNYVEYFPKEDGIFRDKSNQILLEGKYTNKEELADYLDYNIIIPENLADLIEYRENEKKGQFLVCDVEIPEDKHDFFSDYPPCVEKIDVMYEDLSPENKEKFCRGRRVVRPESTVVSNGKLIPNLRKKTNYFIHVALFALYRRLGVKFTIKKVVQFDQDYIFKDFVEIAMVKRKQAVSEFYSTLMKLINNGLYGRMLMQTSNHKDFELVYNGVRNERGYDKEKLRKMSRLDRVLKKQILSREIINEDLILFETEKTSVRYNRPIPIGCAILDLSKLLMANYYYNVYKKHWNCSLAYTDTDSFVIEFHTDNFEKDLLDKGISHLYDLSNMNKKLIEPGNIYDQLIKQETDDIQTLEVKGNRGMTWEEVKRYMTVDKIDLIILEDENGERKGFPKERVDNKDPELMALLSSANYNNKKVRKGNGLMKDECEWNELVEGVFLSSKSYSMLYKLLTRLKQKMTAKGVKSLNHSCLHHTLYKLMGDNIPLTEEERQEWETEIATKLREKMNVDVTNEEHFEEGRFIKGSQVTIQSDKNHQLQTLEVTKILLNNFNDKRYQNLPYGHKDISN